jgi:hypothetical protein
MLKACYTDVKIGKQNSISLKIREMYENLCLILKVAN